MCIRDRLYRAGTANGSDLGGLYKSMPWSTTFCIIGAASISGFPLFSGFVTKSMILTAAADEGYWVTWTILLFASAGVFHHSGIKIPYFAFFAHDSGIRCKEAPANMLVAMGIAAVLCVGIGVMPGPLYSILPYPVDYAPYTTPHVVNQLQLLMFSALAFIFLQRTGLYPPELPSVNLDVDAIYRKLLPASVRSFVAVGGPLRDSFFDGSKALVSSVIASLRRHHGPQGVFERTWLTSGGVLVVLILLAGYLVFYYGSVSG